MHNIDATMPRSEEEWMAHSNQTIKRRKQSNSLEGWVLRVQALCDIQREASAWLQILKKQKMRRRRCEYGKLCKQLQCQLCCTSTSTVAPVSSPIRNRIIILNANMAHSGTPCRSRWCVRVRRQTTGWRDVSGILTRSTCATTHPAMLTDVTVRNREPTALSMRRLNQICADTRQDRQLQLVWGRAGRKEHL